MGNDKDNGNKKCIQKKKLENTKQGKNLIWSGKPKVSNKKLQHIRHKALIIKRIKDKSRIFRRQ